MNKILTVILFNTIWLNAIGQQLVSNTGSRSQNDANIKKSTKFILSSGFSTNISSETVLGSNEKNTEIPLGNKTAPIGVEINYLPLFGGYSKTQSQLIEDEMFLTDCDKNFETREKASAFFAKMGWEYLEEGNKNNAVHRFNLSWLLSKTNPEAYWGLGVIEYQSSNLLNASKLMSNSLDFHSEPNHILMVDLATIYIQMSVNNVNAALETAKARELLQTAIKTQPKYVMSYMQLTLVDLIENKIDDAWEAFHKGYELSPSEVNQEILQELLTRKPDPKGLLK